MNYCGNHYYVYAGDRGELPNPEWVYNLYYKEFSKYLGATHDKEMITSLKDSVEQYNVECSETCALMDNFEDGNFVIAIASPLMKRISSGLDESGEISFIDASGNVDRYGCKIFLLYTNSCAGGLPIEAFYEIKILDVAANRPAQYLKKKFSLTKKQIKHLECKQLGSILEVKNNYKNTIYNFDLDLGICSCPEGDTGKPCKHQMFVVQKLILSGMEYIQKLVPIQNENISKTPDEQELSNKLEKTTNIYLTKEGSEMVAVSDEVDQLNINRKKKEDKNEENNGLEVFDTVVIKIREAIESDTNYFLPGINAINNSFKKNK
ncbi:hypothetical protein AGLY_016237 [Aphis glycines]|uniref:SWIM-type domain-containing protein n=1 Tax=Aphis glycines TaxID=307491 RepID=A0A6G0SY87_APHGL|nr:hypothetical protein AGLY_016237 [Aphis glycines]